MAMKESTKAIFAFLQEAERKGDDYTASDVAEILGISKTSVECSFTAAIQNKKLGKRVEAEVENPDGTHQTVKLLKLNEAGMAVNLDAE